MHVIIDLLHVTMVCISCILIPLALYIWHKFLQPIVAAWCPSLAKSVEQKLEKTEGQEKKGPLDEKDMAAEKDVAAEETNATSATEHKKEQ